VPELSGPAELRRVRDDVNQLLDIVDAFVRESGASLMAASEGRYHRQFLLRGMPGTLRDGAGQINAAHASMRSASRRLGEREATRRVLVDKVVEVSTHVAAASTELGASAGTLAASARSGVGEADAALVTVHALEESSAHIRQAVTLIKAVTA
jgi:hypothetical protein